MTTIDELVEHAAQHATAPEGPGVPRRELAIVVCMDARIDPAAIFGLATGDAHVIRNAGGIVTDDVIRSLAISQHGLGTRSIMVVQHDECGMMKITDAAFVDQLEGHAGVTPTWPVGAFEDVETSVRRSVARLRDCSFLVGRDDVRGFVYDVRDGRLREVR